jgi:zinc transport system permease protein
MELLQDIAQYTFLKNAFFAAILASITCGIIGTYIVSRRLVFLSGGITHSSFGGIGLGYFLGFHPILGAAVFGIFTALGIELFVNRGDLRRDSVIGIWWSLGMAIGIFFIYLTPGYTPNLMAYLFGNILTVAGIDLWLLVILLGIIVLVFAAFYYTILFSAFDAEYAKVLRLPVQTINYVMISLVALTLVFNIKVVGIILVISLLTIPPSIGSLYSNSFGKIALIAIFTGMFATFTGLLGAYYFDIPSGASIIFALFLLFVVLKTLQKLYLRIQQ